MEFEVQLEAAGSEIVVGYWGIRGLGAPLRMMVMYAGAPLRAVNYDAVENQEHNGADRSAWFDVKERFREKNPLINLPYVIIEKRVISQSTACMLAVGRKLNLLGKTEEDLENVEQLLCEAGDLRQQLATFAYRGTESGEEAIRHICAHNSNVFKLNAWLQRKYTNPQEATFFVGDSATAADFAIWELLDLLLCMAQFFSLPSPLASDYPHLQAFHANFAALPANQRYLSSKLYALPFNFMLAPRFGATPSGAAWEFGKTEHTWKGASGLY